MILSFYVALTFCFLWGLLLLSGVLNISSLLLLGFQAVRVFSTSRHAGGFGSQCHCLVGHYETEAMEGTGKGVNLTPTPESPCLGQLGPWR